MAEEANQYTVDQKFEIGVVYLLTQKLIVEGCEVSSKLGHSCFNLGENKKDLVRHLTEVNLEMSEKFQTEIKESKEAQVDGFLLVNHQDKADIEVEINFTKLVFSMPCAICIEVCSKIKHLDKFIIKTWQVIKSAVLFKFQLSYFFTNLSYHNTRFPRAQLFAATRNIYGLVISDGDSGVEGRALMAEFNKDNKASLLVLDNEYFLKRIDFVHVKKDTTNHTFERFLDEQKDFGFWDYSQIYHSSDKKSRPSESKKQSHEDHRSPKKAPKGKTSSRYVRAFNSDKPCKSKMMDYSEPSEEDEYRDFLEKRAKAR